MRYFSLFSGIGGFELGIQYAFQNILHAKELQHETTDTVDSERRVDIDRETRLGSPECVGYSEIDKYAVQVYKKHFPNHKNYGDITKINADELPDFDFLCGGFPCQAFSIAGLRRGFEDTRGTLFFDITRILQAKRPSLLLLENVKGLLSHDKGATFERIIQTLDELGYDLQWQVLNSKNFGVPQNRERVFIIGHLRGTSRPEVFPFGETNPKTLKYVGGILSEKAKQWLDDGKQFSRNFSQGSRVYADSGISATLASQAGGLGAKTGLYLARVSRKEGVYDMRETQTSGTLTATVYKGIDASGRTGVKDGVKIRRLTPKECERLQGFPDNWTQEGVLNQKEYHNKNDFIQELNSTFGGEVIFISDTQRYKMCGNAVTVNVIQSIMEKLLK